MTLLEAALDYARRGISVFPCKPQTKEPQIRNYFILATTGEKKIRDWWTKWPDANIGVPTGETNGFFVVDPDDAQGAETLKKVQEEHGVLPETYTVQTGHGRHLYFTQPNGIETKSAAGLLGPRLDVKGDGGFVLAPPSIHPETKKPYTVIHNGGAATAPDWLLSMVRADAEKKNATKNTGAKGETKIPYGLHYDSLLSVAGKLRQDGIEAGALESVLVEICEKRCEGYGPTYKQMCKEIAESVTKYYEPGADWPEVAETLRSFNARFYVIGNLGGKCRVCWEEPSPVFASSFDFSHQSFQDFRNRFNNQLIQVGVTGKGNPVHEGKGSVWLDHKDRRQYDEVVYAPEQKLPETVRNLWRGYAYEPKKEDCSLYLQHLLENVCQGERERFDWLIGWMAYAVRHPNEPGHTCPVLVGGQGVGKNSAADTFAHLWGAHNLIISQRSQFTGHFNAHLRACSVLVVNEAFFAGDRSQAGPMKALITDPFLAIEAKGIDVVRARNLLHIIIVSNEEWVVPGDLDSRRFTVLRTSDAHREDAAYFGALHAQLGNGGYGALLYHLLHEVDITGFNPRKILATEELNEQKAYSLSGIESVWFECLQRGCLPGKINEDGATLRGSDLVDWAAKKHHRGWDSLKTEYVGYLFGINPRGKKKGMGFQKLQVADVFDQGRVRVWTIPPLVEARTVWDQKRFVADWGDEKDVEWKIDKDWADEQQAKQWRSNAGSGGQSKNNSGEKQENES